MHIIVSNATACYNCISIISYTCLQGANKNRMKTILVVEDYIDASENTAEILETANYMVVTAANGKTGIQLAALCQLKPTL